MPQPAPPARPSRLRRALLPDRERRVGPPRPGTTRQDKTIFVLLLVVATAMTLAGIAYAFWAYG